MFLFSLMWWMLSIAVSFTLASPNTHVCTRSNRSMYARSYYRLRALVWVFWTSLISWPTNTLPSSMIVPIHWLEDSPDSETWVVRSTRHDAEITCRCSHTCCVIQSHDDNFPLTFSTASSGICTARVLSTSLLVCFAAGCLVPPLPSQPRESCHKSNDTPTSVNSNRPVFLQLRATRQWARYWVQLDFQSLRFVLFDADVVSDGAYLKHVDELLMYEDIFFIRAGPSSQYYAPAFISGCASSWNPYPRTISNGRKLITHIVTTLMFYSSVFVESLGAMVPWPA